MSATDSRRYRFLDALFKALEKRGFKVRSDRYSAVWLESGQERIEFTLAEHIQQVKRRLNEEERRNPSYRGQEWRQDRVPSGRLVFKIKTWIGDRIPCQWKDEEGEPLEQQIGKIIAAFVVAGPWLVEKRRRDELQERERWEEQRRRDKETSNRKREDNQWRCFLRLAKQWREAEMARQFLAALEAMPATGEAVGGRSLEEWAAWTRSQIKVHDPLDYAVETVWNTLAVVTAWDVEK
ncbi:MAG: hypothetical protein K2Y27_23900 [Xanthobacteraceae bacterium]|nr:hypothetical protein [Xanthobacteraceae bacterium]